jgi:formylglycine-generating enzyme required for sulfatase activity
MTLRALGRVLLLLAVAASLGWGSHRIFQRLALRPDRVPRTGTPLPSPLARDFGWVPPGRHALGDPASGTPARVVDLPGFWMGEAEVAAASFAEFLNATRNDSFTSPQFVREGGAWQAIRPAQPVSHVSLAQARAFAQWFGMRWKCRARLPRADEWEAAARGGVTGAPFAWGWGHPDQRAIYATNATARAAWYPANGFGLYDCSGGVAEWCEPEAAEPPGTSVVRGGSWSDRDPAQLQPGREHRLPADYRDADVGFRILIE